MGRVKPLIAEVEAQNMRLDSLCDIAKSIGLEVKDHSEAPLYVYKNKPLGTGGMGSIFELNDVDTSLARTGEVAKGTFNDPHAKAQCEYEGLAADSGWIEDFLVQLVVLVHKLHSQGVLHKDLTLGNLMMVDETSNLYLIDFGLSTLLNGKRPLIGGGTPEYQPPEVLRDSICLPAVPEDWFAAVGVLLVLLGKLIIGSEWLPYHTFDRQRANRVDMYYYMMRAKGIIWPEDLMKKHVPKSEQWRSLLEGLTQRKPAMRWGVREMSEDILSRVAAARPLLRDDIQELQDMRGRFMEEEFKLKEAAAADEQLLMKQKEINAKDSLKQHSRADDLLKTHDIVIASGEQVLSSNQEELQTVTRGRKNKAVVRKEAATLKQVIAMHAVPGNLVVDASKTKEAVQAVMKAQGARY
ncbi:hypothetical protein CEUSTIGMA_g9961.t1 [Chlamydomonas eustigma]|uniref:non-specific serine/threonine protein kinase n=1 Tax=Chlamydomonas eustigma TaxID=1157962 RepID=A0A250XHI2_9CHLO|nr:hypothetical protein CEUSTIGMA_g9961.t1 [Chlamydomonas eustigma]|eukprot:GAX82534.1 hypothetical protein CEUSTIGMA_g9961.t1 [Chlamydomonas eustigma]